MTDRPPLYPVDAWRIRELSFEPGFTARNETIFSLANGHLGLRGNFEEEPGNAVHGTYVNGFFEEAPITYGEIAFGYSKNHQVLLNLADGQRIQLHVGDEPLDLATGTVEAYERALDLRTGVVTRSIRWRAPGGTVVDVLARRLVSLTRPCVAAIDYAVAVVEGAAPLRIVSAINARVRNQEASEDPRVGAHLPNGALRTMHMEASGSWGAVVQRTHGTRLAVVAAADHDLGGDEPARAMSRTSSVGGEDGVAFTVDAAVATGMRIALTKYLAYCTSLDHPEETLVARAREGIEDARARGFDGLVDEQRAELDRFWAASDVEIDGDGALQQGVRFNLFSIFQSAGRDGRTSLAAKGLSGEGYEGHYFWDTEIFALPFFVYTQPAIARALLRYRCGILDRARSRAAEMSQRGALFPWRTIGGDETSAYFPAGTAQYHINADIAHGIAKYMAVTADRTLLRDGGAEVVFETARLWADLGDYIPAWDGAFCINEVTGPDEYTALVNNNCYTNVMARDHLRYAVTLAAEMADEEPEEYRRIAERIGLDDSEVAEWRRASELMRIPRDDQLGIHTQDDSFLARARWDFAATPASMYPLLLHYHPLVIYRHQVLKQPDVVLAQVLLGSQFTMAEKKRNFDYYDPLTTGDSSLSPCIQSVAAAELGYGQQAYEYFMRTARMDLDDVNGNVSHGVHVAAMAGSWVSLVYGFGGLRDDGGRISFSPRLPAQWSRLRFRLMVRDAILQVTVTGQAATYELLAGTALEIDHFGRPVRVDATQAATIELAPRPGGGHLRPRRRDHRHGRAPLPGLAAPRRRGRAAVRPRAQRAPQGREPDGESRDHPRQRRADRQPGRPRPPGRSQECLLPGAHRGDHARRSPARDRRPARRAARPRREDRHRLDEPQRLGRGPPAWDRAPGRPDRRPGTAGQGQAGPRDLPQRRRAAGGALRGLRRHRGRAGRHRCDQVGAHAGRGRRARPARGRLDRDRHAKPDPGSAQGALPRVRQGSGRVGSLGDGAPGARRRAVRSRPRAFLSEVRLALRMSSRVVPRPVGWSSEARIRTSRTRQSCPGCGKRSQERIGVARRGLATRRRRVDSAYRCGQHHMINQGPATAPRAGEQGPAPGWQAGRRPRRLCVQESGGNVRPAGRSAGNLRRFGRRSTATTATATDPGHGVRRGSRGRR